MIKELNIIKILHNIRVIKKTLKKEGHLVKEQKLKKRILVESGSEDKEKDKDKDKSISIKNSECEIEENT